MASSLYSNNPIEVTAPNVTYTDDHIEAKYVYETTDVQLQGNNTVATPLKETFYFKTQRRVPRVGMMIVGKISAGGVPVDTRGGFEIAAGTTTDKAPNNTYTANPVCMIAEDSPDEEIPAVQNWKTVLSAQAESIQWKEARCASNVHLVSSPLVEAYRTVSTAQPANTKTRPE